MCGFVPTVGPSIVAAMIEPAKHRLLSRLIVCEQKSAAAVSGGVV